jgi:hypothetical protein
MLVLENKKTASDNSITDVMNEDAGLLNCYAE